MHAIDDYQLLVHRLVHPMVVVTVASAGERAGCLVGFETQASIHPPRVLVLLSKENRTYRVAKDATALVVHYLHDGSHHLAELFGGETGDELDKFRYCEWTDGPGGAPILSGTLGWVAGAITGRLDAGDHVAHVVEVSSVGLGPPRALLTSRSIGDVDAGHPV
jgi:flavin reductase (DIM6/NTAB) family NADH-FMN oxidoreductase RutF